ncbi:MAG: TrkA family potassium uptake protein [Polyangiaceae bacterium]
MRIVVAGGGRVGLAMASHLASVGHAVTLIDLEPDVAKVAFEAHGLVALAGDATDPRMLAEADAAHADVVVTMLPRDADNLGVAALARGMGARRIMGRVKDAAYRPLLRSAGVDRILSETEVFIGALAVAIEHEAVKTSMLVGAGRAVAFELELASESAVSGKTVSEIARDPAFPSSCVVAGLVQVGGRVDMPRGASVLEQGVTLLLVASREDVGASVEFFSKKQTTKENGRDGNEVAGR